VLLTPTGVLTLLVSRFTRSTSAPYETETTDAFASLAVHPLGGLVPLSCFVAFSLRHDVKIDWTGAPWLGAVPALAVSIVWFGTKGVRGMRAWVYSAWGPTAVFMLLLYSAGLHYLPWGCRSGIRRSPGARSRGLARLGRQINAIANDLRRQTGQEPVIVGMDRYELASQLTFYAPITPVGEGDLEPESLWPGRPDVRALGLVIGGGQPAVAARGVDPHDLSDELTAPYVATLDPPKEGMLSRAGTEIRNFHYRIAPRAGSSPGAGPAGTTSH